MSLNWQFTEEKVWEAIPKTDKEASITDTIIWGTMSVSLGSIKEDNIEEWLVRLDMLRRVGRSLARISGENGIEDWNPGMGDLRKRIGLVTNATNRTRNQFKKNLTDGLERDAIRVAKQKMKKGENNDK